jgi:uncharacterized protein with GYD domain
MSLYILATRVAGGSLHTPETIERLEGAVMSRVREECPEIRWLQSLAVCGPYDYLDIIEAPSLQAAVKVSVLIRTYGHSHSELWPGLEWRDFKEIVRKLPREEQE